jgi:hypothetical protein
MTIAQHLATIDRLCSQDFPEEHGGTYAGPGGPGFHIVELERSDGIEEGNGWEQEDQLEACRDGIGQRFTARWGEPDPTSLDGFLLRAQDTDEHIPEPWASLGSHVRNVDLWRADDHGRWIALGVSRPGEAQELRLLAMVTDIDPP